MRTICLSMNYGKDFKGTYGTLGRYGTPRHVGAQVLKNLHLTNSSLIH